MEILFSSARIVAGASGGNPITAVLVVFLFYLGFNCAEAIIERLIWGERFEHFLDPIFVLAFMSHAALCVYYCSK